jgi:hypothetical protein
MAKKKRTKLTPEFWKRNAETMRRLQERLAYHEARLAEERAARERR